MTPDHDPGPVTPDRSTPKTLGILNIIFAVVLMACGICQNFYALLPSLMNFSTEMQGRRDAEFEARTAAEVAKLKEQEAAAPEGEEREAIMVRRVALETVRPPGPPRAPIMAAPGLRDPRLLGHFLGDLVTNLILNVLMLVAGAGLIFLKPWARSLAVVVAWAKILRLLALAASITLVVSPLAVGALAAMEDEAAAADPPAAAGPRASATLGLVITSGAWGIALGGSIYPAITLWMLGRRSVRDAFAAAPARARPSW